MSRVPTSDENAFKRFFYSEQYIALKNYLFNYRMRKRMIRLAFQDLFGVGPFPKSFTLADIGSGVSPVSPLLSHTTFIELEPEAIKYLTKKKLKVIRGDITHLKLKSNTFDAIVCSEVLEHVKDYPAGLREMARVVKPGGVIIITVPTHMHHWHDDDAFVGHFRRFNPLALHKVIEQSGLAVIDRIPIGSRVERWLTVAMIWFARKSEVQTTRQWKGVKLYAYRCINHILFGIIWLAQKCTTEQGSSISLFVARKK